MRRVLQSDKGYHLQASSRSSPTDPCSPPASNMLPQGPCTRCTSQPEGCLIL